MCSSFSAHRRNYEFGARLRAAMDPPCQEDDDKTVPAGMVGGGGIFDRFRFRETPPPNLLQPKQQPPLSAAPSTANSVFGERAAVSEQAAARERCWRPLRPWSRMPEERRRHTRSVSGYRKRYVAASQSWKCAGRCGQLLPASFEVDHIVRLDRGGDNSVTNLVALCRNCHGHKTFVEML